MFFTIPLARLRGNNVTRNILSNPGGPGGSGLKLAHARGALLKRIVGDNFHIVGFDPCGVGGSWSATTCYPNEETRRQLAIPSELSIPGHSGNLWALTANFVLACADDVDEYSSYINTSEIVADVNNIPECVLCSMTRVLRGREASGGELGV